MFKKLRDIWESIKAWFKYSETILLARVEAFAGILIAALEGVDWSPLLTLDFANAIHNKQALYIGGLIFAKGLILEIARRRRATDL